jgi:hypothetical protein
VSSGGNWKEMFHAACDGDDELVRLHARLGVDLNYAHPEFLSTPLVACILAGRESTAMLLLELGAAPDLHSEFDASTPWQAAQRMKMPRLQARLEALGAGEPRKASPQAAAPLPWWKRVLRGGAGVE